MKSILLPHTLLCLFAFFGNQGLSQTTSFQKIPECGNEQLKAYLALTHLELLELQHQQDLAASDHFRSRSKAERSVVTLTLPVVVHIIHLGSIGNISDLEVNQGIQNLNDAFANTGFYDQGTGVNTQIQFCLATRTPEGSPTTGINRVESPLTNVSDFSQDIPLKNLIRWDPLHYINIWLVNSIQGGIIAGYGTFPSSHGQPEDGIVMVGPLVPMLGSGHSTLVHEMGHYLGLYHTFSGGCTNNDCLLDGDQVCDTPPDNSTVPPGDCSAIVNSCTTDTQSGFSTDQNDLNWNYLDYGNHVCRSGFTQGQSDRMNYFIENARQSLLESQACQDPCLNPILAMFDTTTNTIPVGASITFQNLSTGATTYNWYVEGQWWSSASNPAYTFNQSGTYTITLEAGNNDPNCSDAFAFTITVQCPVVSGFNSSSLYAPPGENLSFTNTSSGASSYSWLVNGVPQVTTPNFNFNPQQAGQYQVCLSASNGLCEKQFCQWVFVVEGSGSCNVSRLKTIGEPEKTELANVILATQDGNLLVGGMHDDKSLLILMNPDGDVLWERTFNFIPGGEFIFEMILDSDENLIATARTEFNAPTQNVTFKYDYKNDVMLWQKLYDEPSCTRLEVILEKESGENYYILGMTDDDNLFMELDRNNGSVIQFRRYNYGQTDFFLSAFIHENRIYSAGVQRNGGLENIRATMSKLKFDGSQDWTRFYFNNPITELARTYFYENFFENDTILAYGRGDLNGSSFDDVEILLMKANLDGDILLANRYNILGSTEEFTSSIIPIPDGYVMQGTHKVTAKNQYEAYVIRVDKSGNLVWAKSIENMRSSWGKNMVLTGGNIYIVGDSKLFDSNGDLLLAILSLNPQNQDVECPYLTDLEISVNPVSNNYQGYQTLVEFTPPFNLPNVNITMSSQSLDENSFPQCECNNNCPNGYPLHGVPDALIGSISTHCEEGQILLQMQICNADSMTLPAGTPVAFYNADPRYEAASLLAQTTLPEAITADSCSTVSWTLSLPAGSLVYAVVNDAGTTPTPFDLESDFPNSGIPECDFSNNLDTFTVYPDAQILELGPDLVTCDFEVAVLDVGAGFIDYQWSSGEISQMITVWLPGTYSVTVSDACGLTQTDSISITENPGTILHLLPDTIYTCPEDTVWLGGAGFSQYQWFPEGLVNCDTCATTWMIASADTCLSLLVSDGNGCYSIDTICLLMGNDTLLVTEQELICPGDSLFFFGNWLSQPGIYEHVGFGGNCFVQTILELVWRQPPSATFGQRPECPYQLDGSIWVASTEGTGPFQFQWEPGGITAPILQGIGAGTYTFTIEDALGCTAVDTIELLGAERPLVNGEVTDVSCHGYADGKVEVWSDYPGMLYSFQGSPFSMLTVYDSIAPGNWQLFTMDSLGCIWEEFFTIENKPMLMVSLPAEVQIGCQDTFQLKPITTSQGLTYQWTPDIWINCTDCPQPYVWPSGDTTYQLVVTDSNGCTALASTHIAADLIGRIYVPNAFSPNNDGINDTFYLLGHCVDKIEIIRIFNRWGGKVFEARNIPLNDPTVGWNGMFKGKPANPDVFAFYAQVRFWNGEIQFISGDITLLK